uniref:Homeobox protein SIX5 n=1 Tax=Anthurium amnicola TaxID=1678845 RepID=A0A1D1Z4C7_9ARAE
MLEAETLTNVLPGVKTIEEGVRIYRNFYTEEREKSNGVLAISLSRLDSQPYISMSALLSGLSYDGVGSLLGIMHTVGTIPDALPPPRSALLSSFMLPYRPDVEGSFLSNGARALAKHVSRSSNGWWGSFVGSDANKNELALEVINRLLTCCCWMNIHSIQPYEHVFEIRIGEGYGARWSRDGSKFIGFLEPHMEEGHAKGWRH